ncbi:MAG: hypothetical protein K0R98_853 [Rickettsiaceae bacterium]|jgi:uncharacterized lipoprotein|nr:hypothetical protein [Rickettsiaceae bacterium]
MKKIFAILTVCLLAACSTTEYRYMNKDAQKSISLHN